MVILNVRESLQVQQPVRQWQGSSKDLKPQTDKTQRNPVLVCPERRFFFYLPDLVCGNNICNTSIFPSEKNEWPSTDSSSPSALCFPLHSLNLLFLRTDEHKN